MSDTPPPIVHALVMCDAVYVDPTTGRRALVGLYAGMGCPFFPAAIGGLYVYVAATEFLGPTVLELRLVDAGEEHPPLADAAMDVDGADPIVQREFDFRLPPFVIPEPGAYVLQLITGGRVITERRIDFVEVSEPEEDADA